MKEFLKNYRLAVAQQGLGRTWRAMATFPIRALGHGLEWLGKNLKHIG